MKEFFHVTVLILTRTILGPHSGSKIGSQPNSKASGVVRLKFKAKVSLGKRDPVLQRLIANPSNTDCGLESEAIEKWCRWDARFFLGPAPESDETLRCVIDQEFMKSREIARWMVRHLCQQGRQGSCVGCYCVAATDAQMHLVANLFSAQTSKTHTPPNCLKLGITYDLPLVNPISAPGIHKVSSAH